MVSVVAYAWSTCRLTQKPIRPGDQITPYLGSWALTNEVVKHERACSEAREFRAQIAYLLNRLGGA